MKRKTNRLFRKVTSCILTIGLLSGLCVTAGLLTTSASTPVGDKVIDLSGATSAKVELGGDLATGSAMASTNKFDPNSGIYVVGKTQTVPAGTHMLSATFKEDAFGKLGNKILDQTSWVTSGDGFKFTALVPTTGTVTTVGMHLLMTYKDGKTEDYYCEKEVVPGQRQDIKMKYADFLRLSTEEDFAVFDKDGNRYVSRPNPGDTTVENQKYIGISKYSLDKVNFASVYVKTTTTAESTVTPKFAVSDISTYKDQIQNGYVTKWNDYNIFKEAATAIGHGGDIPYEVSKTDIFAPNGGIYVWGDRTLHADAVDKNGKNYDQGPKNIQLHWQNFEDLTPYTGIKMQVKITSNSNISMWGSSLHIGAKLWIRDPVTNKPDASCYIFEKYIGVDEIDQIKTVTMQFDKFKIDDPDGEKMPASDLSRVSNIVIYSMSEYYTDRIITSDLYISDIYGYNAPRDPLPTPEDTPTTTYPPEADPEDPITGSDTTTEKPLDTTSTTNAPEATTTTAVDKTTATTVDKTTATTPKPITTNATTTTTKSPTTIIPTSSATSTEAPTKIDPSESEAPTNSGDETTTTEVPVTEAPSNNNNPNTGAAAPIGLAFMTGTAGMAIFFTRKKKK